MSNHDPCTPEIIRSLVRRAYTPKRCRLCGGEIVKNTRYNYEIIKQYGKTRTRASHLNCERDCPKNFD